jgi:hypothetical protein
MPDSIDTYTDAAAVKRLFSKHAADERLEDVAEIQKVVRGGTPTSGTFTLTYGSETSSTIAYNADQYAFEAGLRTIFSLRRSRVLESSGTTPNFTHILQLVDITGDASALSGNTGGLAGGTPTITVTELQAGDDAALDDAIVYACEEINKYAFKHYSPTAMLRSNLVAQWATWLSCYNLAARKGDDPPKVFAVEYEKILKQLLMIMNGAMDIPGIPKRRASAPIWTNQTADIAYSYKVLRRQKGTSSKKPASTRPTPIDYRELGTYEI